jgi:VWFA-related protein
MTHAKWLVGATIVVTTATLSAQSMPPRHDVTWLIFVDDLHLDFRNTGRIRDLLRRLATELIQDGDTVAVQSSGPSKVSVDFARGRSLLMASIKHVAGNALRFSDVGGPKPDPSVVREVRDRATGALEDARTAIANLASAPAPAGRRAMIYVSNGYNDDKGVHEQVVELTRFAKETGVLIFAVDPRGLISAMAEPSADATAWMNHATTTRETLRMLSEMTGGFAVFENLADGLKRIAAASAK